MHMQRAWIFIQNARTIDTSLSIFIAAFERCVPRIMIDNFDDVDRVAKCLGQFFHTFTHAEEKSLVGLELKFCLTHERKDLFEINRFLLKLIGKSLDNSVITTHTEKKIY